MRASFFVRLHARGGIFGENGALAFLARHCHLPAVGTVLHFFGSVAEAVGALVKERVIDLVWIAEQDDLRADTGAGDDALGLFRRQILRFVDDQICFCHGAAADEIERLGGDDVASEKLLDFSDMLPIE